MREMTIQEPKTAKREGWEEAINLVKGVPVTQRQETNVCLRAPGGECSFLRRDENGQARCVHHKIEGHLNPVAEGIERERRLTRTPDNTRRGCHGAGQNFAPITRSARKPRW
ncbi:MAG: hypothetical protein AAB573_01440 [Patescibacteria group bacterium]